ncbi:MAG: S-layer homology domain-containing protein [Boseongicola sp. SB0673_bin_14]|nr:S-layer homology domain-containing protein [Boseongicola sp. SB0673_bin_14]
MKKLAIGFVICIVFLLGALANSALSQRAGFTDMDGHTHERAAEWAADNGVMSGYPDGTFRPDVALTRGQVAEVLYRYHHGLVRKLEGDVARLHNKAIRHTHDSPAPTGNLDMDAVRSYAKCVAYALDDYNAFPPAFVYHPAHDCRREHL